MDDFKEHIRLEDWFITKRFEEIMEEMANAPKEEMGKRQPGEKCGYEIQPTTAFK